VIDHGRVIEDGTVAAIKDRFAGWRRVVVDLEEPAPALDLGLAGVTVEKVEGPRQWLRFDRTATTAAAVVSAVVARTRIVDLSVEDPDIEDVITTIYTRPPTP
jgi:ABC-2 type transport system ATP-binding protein